MAENKSKKKTTQSRKQTKFSTHSGHPLTPKEAKFIDEYMLSGNIRQSVIKAGYETTKPDQYGNRLLKKEYMTEEINFRLQSHKNDKIASRDELLEYLTRVMRGEEKDQFGLDASLSERTKACQELCKRVIDVEDHVAGKEPPKLVITVDWGEDASANVGEVGESIDAQAIQQAFDTKPQVSD
jgi:phage terminase small subunit